MHDELRQKAEAERYILLLIIALGAHHDDFAFPDLRQAEFVHRNGDPGPGNRRFFDEDDIARRIRFDHENGTAILHEKHDRTGRFETQQLLPFQPNGLGPHALFAHPFDQNGGRWDRGGRIQPERRRIQVDTVIARDRESPDQPGM
ncbi:hypothetical protein [Acidisoma cellulosilyticum]|uniref:hypothetical protein n=1 Tax=Acidisoma cellulosilyticum TaxID=2802395 RepID=UPI001D0B33D4|nr:hypothetical protein [Acidisoma cellulosilyticum]